MLGHLFSMFFFFNDTATTEIYTLSLHDALPILGGVPVGCGTGTLAVAWPLRFPLLWGRPLGRRGARPFCRPERMRRHGIPSYTVVLHPFSLQKIECAYQSEARQEPARDSQVRVERPARRRSSLWQAENQVPSPTSARRPYPPSPVFPTGWDPRRSSPAGAVLAALAVRHSLGSCGISHPSFCPPDSSRAGSKKSRRPD